MKRITFIISAIAVVLSACNTHRSATVQNSLLVGTWEQPNLTLDLKSNGRYHYHYKEDGYSYEQSGKYSYFVNKDSVVLYNYYPQAYTTESKNVSWSIRKLSTDSLAVYVHKPTMILDGDTLYTIGDTVETFVRK